MLKAEPHVGQAKKSKSQIRTTEQKIFRNWLERDLIAELIHRPPPGW